MRHEQKVALWVFGPVFAATAIGYVALGGNEAEYDPAQVVQADQVEVDSAEEPTPTTEPTPKPTVTPDPPVPSPSPEFTMETTAEFNFGWTAGYNQGRLEWQSPCVAQSSARNKEQYRQMTVQLNELRRVLLSVATPTPTPVPLSGPRR